MAMKPTQSVPLPKKALTATIIVLISIVLDQFAKFLAAKHLRGRPGYSFLWDTVRLEYAENSGAFLSLGANLDQSTRTLFFVVGVLFIIGCCVFWLLRTPQTWMSVVALSLVISGGIGNLIDRISRGSVIDFIYMGIGPVHTGVFNVADIAITGGVMAMLFDQYILEKRKAVK